MIKEKKIVGQKSPTGCAVWCNTQKEIEKLILHWHRFWGDDIIFGSTQYRNGL